MPSPKSKSALVEALEAVAVGGSGKCMVGTWIDSLSDDDRAYLESRLRDLPKGTVYRAVSKFAGCSATTWNRHFANDCSCRETGAADA